jgi:uncharacterized protein (UPF0276 family)
MSGAIDTPSVNAISGEYPKIDAGISLRAPWVDELARARPEDFDCLEILAESYLHDESAARDLTGYAERWPVMVHASGLSVGGPDPLDRKYLSKLKRLAERVGALFVSDHAGLSRARGVCFHHVFPLPFTEEAALWMARRSREAAERLGFPLALENIWCPATMPGSVLSEGEFLGFVLDHADLGLVLDLDNLCLNASAQGRDPEALLREFPLRRLWQVHLGARRDERGAISDTVWKLYRTATASAGPRFSVIERESPLPPLARVLLDVEQARAVQRTAAFGLGLGRRTRIHDLAS